jgi:hypothetical protein
MANYPKNIPDVRTALLAFSLQSRPEEVEPEVWDQVAAKVDAAQAQASPVVQFVGVLDALKDHVGLLDAAGASLLAGSAHLIAANAWHGKGEEALGVRDAAVVRLAMLES